MSEHTPAANPPGEEPWRAGYRAAQAEVVAAEPAQQFLFDRQAGLLEYLWERAYHEGQRDLLDRQLSDPAVPGDSVI